MAHPKRRQSNQRTRKRRTNDRHKLTPPARGLCPNCGVEKLPHRICGGCGYYGARKILEIT